MINEEINSLRAELVKQFQEAMKADSFEILKRIKDDLSEMIKVQTETQGNAECC